MNNIDEELIKYKKYLNKLAVIKNIFVIICFTVLAIIFHKWWIVLLSFLLMSYIGKDDDNGK